MSVLVLTGSSNDMKHVLEASMPSKQQYCKEKNYNLKVITLSGKLEFERPLNLFNELKEYDFCMWLDADAIITNKNYNIEDFIAGEKPFSASLDWTDTQTISMGNFVIQNTQKTEELLSKYFHFCETSVHDQDAMNCVLNISPELVNVLPRKYLNAVPSIVKKYRVGEERDIVEHWDDSCFLAHLTTISNDDRINIMKNNLLFSEKSIDQQLGMS